MEEIIARCLPTYQVEAQLGEGIYGNVYLVRDDYKKRAVKVVPLMVERSLSYYTPRELDSKISQDFHAVRRYYEDIKGSGVVEIYDFHLVEKMVSETKAQAYLVILMELCAGNLHDYVLNHFPVPCQKCCEMMLNLAEVLKRLSAQPEKSFLVTDLKPTNLLINHQGRILIGDLGGIKRLGSLSTTAGAQFSPNWSAPEMILKGERPAAASMVYSFGLVTYFAIEGRLPHENCDFTERIYRMRERGIGFTRTDVDSRLTCLIQACLEFDPGRRIGGFDQIIEILTACMSDTPPLAGGRPLLQISHLRGEESEERRKPVVGRSVVPGAFSSGTPRAGATWRESVSGMVFVWVPEGGFQMGCDPRRDTEAFPNEGPLREVLVEGFWIGRCPVTQEQWARVMKSNPSHYQESPQHPVEQVSWHDAVDFVQRLSSMTGEKYHFALPSESQWEFAARSGGRDEKYAGGSDIERYAWYQGNSGYSTHPVGVKEPNGLGIYDMCGNVMEWCENFYEETVNVKIGAFQDGGDAGDEAHRVGRGGAWNLEARRCRTTARRGISARLRYSNLGFRLVRIKNT